MSKYIHEIMSTLLLLWFPCFVEYVNCKSTFRAQDEVADLD